MDFQVKDLVWDFGPSKGNGFNELRGHLVKRVMLGINLVFIIM